MKTSSITAISGLLSVVLAQPHNHARHHHEKRDIVWETVWEVVTETIGVTSTVTVDPPAATTSTPIKTTPSSTPVATIPSSTPVAAISSTTPVLASNSPGRFIVSSSSIVPSSSSVFVPAVVPTLSTPVAVAAKPSTTPVYVPPTTSTSVYVAPTTFSSVYTPPVVATTPAYTPPVVATTPVYVPPTTTSTSASAPSSSSSSGQCSAGSPCSGDLTYYTTGEGACGWNNNGLLENIVALSHEMMGSESNDGTGGMNPYCGKHIKITYGSATTTAKVVDKCMGCSMYAIDLSTLAFSLLTSLDAGRVQGEWHFID